jgi:hypothetical protein
LPVAQRAHVQAIQGRQTEFSGLRRQLTLANAELHEVQPANGAPLRKLETVLGFSPQPVIQLGVRNRPNSTALF